MSDRERRRPLTTKELEAEMNSIMFEMENKEEVSALDQPDSDDDEDYIQEQERSDTEQSGETETEEPGPSNAKKVKTTVTKGKNGYRWTNEIPEKRGRRQRKNLVSHLPGPRGAAKTVKSPLEAWSLLFSNDIINTIVVRSNEEIRRRWESINVRQSYHSTTDSAEIKALFGLLYLCGVQRSAYLNLHELWSPKFGTSLFRATMPLNRFDFLTSALRFDEKATRAQRRQNDKFAPIREIWETFVSNCTAYYTPHEYCTIDEQLMGYRGRCPFRIYLASKPDKYGIKFVMMNDARTWYMISAIPYVGKVTTENNMPVPFYYVKKLSQPIYGTGRNITTDNWFSSVDLFENMLTEHGLTMIGTLRKNKREIPPNFLAGKIEGESKFVFDHNKTLVSYTPKQKKVVLLLSTMHYSNDVDETTNKPVIVLDYNSTKGGTDTFDKLCHTFTTARSTRRWPMRVFCGMLDHAGINAMVLYNFSATNNPKLVRREFLNTLAFELIEPFLKCRLDITTLRKGLKCLISEIVDVDIQEKQEAHVLEKKVRCGFCDRSKDRKTKLACSTCHVPICDEHRSKKCLKCAE